MAITDLTWQQLETASGTSLIIVDDDLGLLLKLSALTNIVNFPPDPKNSEGVVQALYRLREFAAKAQATVNAGQSIGSRLAAFPPASNGTAGFFTYGLAGGEPVFDNRGYKRTPTEETADEVTKLGKQSGSQIKDAVDNSKKLLDDLWRNKPTFEIPQIKIPKFDIPELPNLEIPKFPEFKFPEISFPKPQPIPIPKLKPIPIPKPKPDINSEWVEVPGGDYCTAYFGFTIRVKKNLIQSISGGISFYGQEENLPPNWGNCSTYSVRNPDLKYPSVVAKIFGYSKTGQYCEGDLDGYVDHIFKLDYTAGSLVNGKLKVQYPISTDYGRFRLPQYAKDSPNYLIDILEVPWELISVQCANLPPLPPPRELPPPPPEDDCCRMGCCPKPTEIDYRLIKAIVDQTLKEQKFLIEVPICKCEYDNKTNKWTPKTDNVQMEVFATSRKQADQLAQLHLDNARQAADLCIARNVEEPIAVIPEWWQARSFQRPQLVIQYAELLGENKLGRSRWSVTIPHYNKPQKYKPSFPKYEKGDIEGILVLNDNSKIIINAKNKTECIRVINAFKQFVDPTYLKEIQKPKVGDRAGVYKKVNVVPVRCHYFSKGQKNNVPDWSLSLREKDSNK